MPNTLFLLRKYLMLYQEMCEGLRHRVTLEHGTEKRIFLLPWFYQVDEDTAREPRVDEGDAVRLTQKLESSGSSAGDGHLNTFLSQ